MDRNYKKIRDHSLIDWNSNENKLDFFSQISFLLAKKKKLFCSWVCFEERKSLKHFLKINVSFKI